MDAGTDHCATLRDHGQRGGNQSAVAAAWVGSGIRIVGIGLVVAWLVRTLANIGVGAAAPDANGG